MPATQLPSAAILPDRPARILYLGHAEPQSTARHRADALTRLGHEVVIEDPYRAMSAHLGSRIRQAVHYRTGYRFLQNAMRAWMSKILSSRGSFDLVWVDNGELLGPRCVELIRTAGIPSVLFNHDDPTGTRDGRRFDSLRKALRLYDTTVAIRDEGVVGYRKLGAQNVIQSYMTYDEVAHAPFADPADIPAALRSEVAFIGTLIPGEDRDGFVHALIEGGIPVSIWGSHWQRSRLWNRLQPHWRGPALGGRDFVAAMQGAKICLGLLSRLNRDGHTTRSQEIPYSGGLLCAERTDDHLRLYDEDREAVFWADADECIAKCRWLLQDDAARERIRLAGMARVRRNEVGSEDLCRRVLESIGIFSSRPRIEA